MERSEVEEYTMGRRMEATGPLLKTAAPRGTPLDILLVEDNPADARLAAEALKESGFPSRLHWAADGIHALEILRGQDEAATGVHPGLILLDLNLPKKDGREVLAEIKRDPALRRIPVIVLTNSRAEADRDQSYDLQANCFINKPAQWDEFVAVVRSIKEFWFGRVALPGADRLRAGQPGVSSPFATAEPGTRGAAGPPLRVLLVEDNPGDIRLVRDLLAGVGQRQLEVLTAGSVRQALVLLGEEKVDAILLDLTLPDGEDLEGLAELHGLMTGVPILVLASQHNEATAARSLRRGAQDYLVKGLFDGEGLARAVGNAIERNRFEKILEYMAQHDVLTELPNRTLLEDRLSHTLEHARRDSQGLAVLFLDLDRFKILNDSLGHVAADQLLQAIAGRLSAAVRASDTVSRVGGDEFVILLPDIDSTEDVTLVARKILDCLRSPFSIGGCEVSVSASLGASVYPQDGSDAETLLKSADTAMYRAKQIGRGNFQMHSPAAAVPRGERESMVIALQRALERDELLLHYQPVVDALSGSIVALEALVRWRHPTGGLLSAKRFLPLAEETGMIVDVGEWVLRHAGLRARDWQGEGLLPMRIVVNVSYRQLNRGREYSDAVARILRETGLEPQRLELDVTEETFLREGSTAVRTLRTLHDLGIRISVDDFGSGFASLIRLKNFPFANIKIARSFIHHVTVNPDDAAVVSTIIAMGHNLRMSVLAQGVSTAEQVAYLLRHQVDLMQGYYFSRPLPEDACTRLIRGPRLHPVVDRLKVP